MADKVPCPVEGCVEIFDTEEEAAAHMKKKHLDVFSAEVPAEKDLADETLVAMVPPEALALLDKRVETKIQAAMEAERPRIIEAMKTAIQQVVTQAQTAGVALPGVPNPLGEGGVVAGSPVTPMGAQFMQFLMRDSGGSDMEKLAATLTQARAISDVLNPPSIWDRVMQNAVLRSLGKAGLVTDAEVKELLTPPAKP